MKKLVLAIAVMVLCALAVAASAQDVILGGTFNKNAVPSDFTYWTGWGDWMNVSDSGDTHTADGTRCLKTKIQGNSAYGDRTEGMGAYQVVALDSGYWYDFSGWAFNADGVEKIAFRVMAGDYSAGDIAEADVIAATNAAFAWESTSSTYVNAAGSFVAQQSAYTVFTMVAGEPGYSGKFDDITLIQGDLAVPEPSSILALCGGLVALLGIRRRRS